MFWCLWVCVSVFLSSNFEPDLFPAGTAAAAVRRGIRAVFDAWIVSRVMEGKHDTPSRDWRVSAPIGKVSARSLSSCLLLCHTR